MASLSDITELQQKIFLVDEHVVRFGVECSELHGLVV